MNQTISGLRSNAVLADRLTEDNNRLNETIGALNEELERNGAQINIL